MSKTEKIYRFGIDVEATTSQAQKDLASLGEILKSLKLPDSTKKSFGELFETANSNLETFIALSSKTTHTEKDVKDLGKAYNNVSNAIAMMSTKLAGIEAMDLKSLLPKDLQKQLKEVRNELQSLQDLAKGDNSEQIQNQTAKVVKQKEKVDELTKSVQELNATLAEGGEQWNKQNAASQAAEEAAAKWDQATKAIKDYQSKHKSIMTQQEYEESKERTTTYRKQHEEYKRLSKGEDSVYQKEKAKAKQDLEDKKQRLAQTNPDKAKKTYVELEIQVRKQQEKYDEQYNNLANTRRKDTNLLKAQKDINQEESRQKEYEEYKKLIDAQQEVEKAKSSATQKAQKTSEETSNFAKKAEEQASKLSKQQAQLQEYEKNLEVIKKAAQGTEGLQNLRKVLAQIQGVDISEIPEDLGDIEHLIDNLESEKIKELAAGMTKFRESTDQAGNTVVKTMGKGTEEINKQKDSVDSLDAQVKSLQNSFLNFFSLTNGWSLLQRAIKNAYATVKELDASMTEIAVVSEYTIDDIWAMRGKYSDAATEMGAKTIDLVDATKLLVQQGLSLNQSLETGIEVTKMARIANLSGADATNLMTAQLRGFNMEMSEANRVSDVFSNLAAKTQADTEEIAVALSKTASIANSAGASFENTSAFLTQIVETTREAPETAGTALKTIIARFQELKKPMSEIGEVEGEVVDANAIETALKTAKVALRDANGEFRNFDDVILELSSKWESLDVMTQRYIQTTQAGSRQQSRFLALMSNNERLTELVGYANNAAGASNQQYEKTLESLEAKINNLNNAMDIFWTNLANSDVIKGAIDLLTKLLNAINGITNGLTQSSNKAANFMGTLAQLGLVIAGFAGGKKILKGGVEKIGGWFFGQGKTKADIAGVEDGEAYQEGFMSGFKKKGGILGIFKEQKENITTFLKDAKKFGQDFQTAWKQGVYSKGEFSEGTNALFENQDAIKKQQGEDSQQYKDQLKLAEEAGNKEVGLGGGSIKTVAVLKGLFGGKESRAAAVKGLGMENMLTGKVMTALPLGYAAIAAAVTVGAAKAWDQLEVTTDEKLEEVGKTIDQFQDSISQTNEKITDLKSSRSTLQGLNDDFNSLVKGSTEWKEKLVEVNQQVLSLINKYPELAQYIERGSQGQMTISEQGWDKVLEEQTRLSSIQQTALGSQRAQQYSLNNQKYAESQMLQGGKGDRSQAVVGVDSLVGAAGLQTAAFINPIVGTIIAGLALGDIIAKLVSGKTLTGRIAEAVDKANAGASSDQYRTMLENMGEKGLGLQDVEALRKEFQKVTDGTGNFDTFYQNLSAMGDNLESVTKESYANKLQQEGQRKAILSNIIANNEYLSAQDKLINQMEGAAKRLVNVDVSTDELEKGLGSDLYKAEDGKIKDALKNEYASIMGMTTDEVNAQLNDKSLSEDTMARVVYAKKQEDELSANMKKTADYLEKLRKTDSKNYGYAKGILGNNGLDLTPAQLQELIGKVGQEITKEKVADVFKQMGISVEELGTTIEAVTENLITVNDSYKDIFTRAESLGIDEEMKKANNNFLRLIPTITTGTQKELQNQIINAYENNGANLSETIKIVTQLISDIAKSNLSDEEKAQAVAQINSTSLSSVTGIQNLMVSLRNLGAETEISVKQIVEAANALNDIDLSKVADQIRGVQSAIKETASSGVRQYEEEKKNELVKSGLLESDFSKQTIDGKVMYVYTGPLSQNEIAKRYGENSGYEVDIAAQIENYRTQLETAEDKLDRAITNSQKFNLNNRENDTIRFSEQLPSTAWINSNTENYEAQYKRYIGNEEQIVAVRELIKSVSKTEQGKDILTYDFWKDSGLRYLKPSDTEGSDDFIAKLMQEYAEKSLSGSPSKVRETLDSMIIKTEAGLQREQNAQEIEKLQKEIDELTKLKEQVESSVAQSVYTQSLGYTYSQITTEEGKKAKEYQDTFYKYLMARADVAGIDEDLQKSLREEINKENPAQEIIEQAIDAINIKEAAQTLSEKISKIVSKIDIQNKIENKEVKTSYIKSILQDFFGENAANFDTTDEQQTSKYLDLLQAMSGGDWQSYKALMQIATGGSIDNNNFIRGSGLQDYIYRAVAAGQTGTREMAADRSLIGSYYQAENGTVQEVTKDVLDKFKGAKLDIVTIANEADFYKMLAEGGLSGKDTKWEASYDWLYNLTKKMNKELRERNKLEKEENNILDARTTTVADLLDNINEQKQSLLQSLSYENERYTKRQKELNKANSDARRYQVSQYVWMDKDNTVQIDYDAIKGITDPAIGNLVKQMVEEYEFLQSEFESIEDNQDEYTSALKEIKTKYLQDSITLENELIEAIHTDRQKQIDKLSEINSSINDANSRMMDKISQGITDIRNAREDDKALKNIQEMEQRLALLRTDTSGANALEILSLEEQLNDARTSYADTQVDRAIDEMTRQNDEAAQQREWQIQLLEDQLEADREYGVLAAQANELIRAALMDGSESQANTIKEILNKASDSQSLGYYGQQDFFDTMQDKVVKGIAGAILSASPEYGQEVTFTDNKGNILKGKAQADGSVFADGKFYTNVFGFEDSNGNFSYMQHQSGKALSEDEWKNQTGLIANTGKVDLVKVSKSTLNEVTNIKEILEEDLKRQKADSITERMQNGKYGSNYLGGTPYLKDLKNIYGTKDQVMDYLKTTNLTDDEYNYLFKLWDAEFNKKKKISFRGKTSSNMGVVVNQPYATGGLNTTTGPAWLDGTKTAPEYVLNAEQTKAFLSLINSLTSYSATSTPLGNNYYNVQIEVDQLANDYDVEQLMNKMKRVIADDALYRNVNAVDLGRR